VHWLSDVIAGLALGWAWVTLCVVVLGGDLVMGTPSRRGEPSL
jgi:membrane-associated phospholipid phosphatase